MSDEPRARAQGFGERSTAADEVLPARLTDEQIEELTGYLRSGRRLPAHLFPFLFETAQEYQLAYAGKARRADVLAETMAVPLQAVKTFASDSAADAWPNMLILGDNLQVLRRLLAMKDAGELRNGDGTDGVRLCYLDPPFATRREFLGSGGRVAYQDKVEGAEFVEFLRRRLILIHELLSQNGTLYVHLDTKKVHYMKVVLDEIFGEHNFRNEIIWKRADAHNDARQGASDFGRIHDTILRYTKTENAVFNVQHLPLPETTVSKWYRNVEEDSGRHYNKADLTAAKPGGDTSYEWNGKRPPKGRYWAYSRDKMAQFEAEGRLVYSKSGMPYMKRYLDESRGVALQDLWTDIGMLRGISAKKERVGYPTQKPEELLLRLLQASSNAGDLVLDPFVGSGTTLVAAEQSEDGPRRWIGIDCGKYAIYASQARLLRRAGKKAPERPFTFYNAGLYDYASLRELPWSDYREFALLLFQCRDAPERVAGVSFDGFLGDHRVLVHNFKEHSDAKIGRQFVEDIARLCGARLGERCFIIAPALAIEPYEDYIDADGTRFFFLRIPYSIIAELHKRAFSELRQPASAAAANATIDSVGFDFIQQPRVECSYTREGDQLVVRILEFESEAYAARPSDVDIADLAMVMADYDYDGTVFDLDAVAYAEDLEARQWELIIPVLEIGTKIMLIYLDLYGNEHREIKEVGDFAIQGSTESHAGRTGAA